MKTYVLMVSQVLPKYHTKAGEPTNFEELILSGIKKHTIRGNYEWWVKRLDEVNAGIARLSVRVWEGKPYRSKQREIAEFFKAGYQSIYMVKGHGISIHIGDDNDTDDFWYQSTAFGFSEELEGFCENDGLVDSSGLTDWFEPMLNKSDGGDFFGILIHLTDLRY